MTAHRAQSVSAPCVCRETRELVLSPFSTLVSAVSGGVRRDERIYSRIYSPGTYTRHGSRTPSCLEPRTAKSARNPKLSRNFNYFFDKLKCTRAPGSPLYLHARRPVISPICRYISPPYTRLHCTTVCCALCAVCASPQRHSTARAQLRPRRARRPSATASPKIGP